MNFKKTIAKSLVVAMALGMVPMANLESARAVISDVKIDGATGIAKATGGASYWGIAKVAKAGKGTIHIGDKDYKITNIQEYYGEIDAYSVLKGKAGIIAAGDTAVPEDKWKVVSIDAADSTFKVQFVASKGAVKGLKSSQYALGGEFGFLVVTTGKKEIKEVNLKTDHKDYQCKLNDGDWQILEKLFGAAPDNDSVKVWSQSASTITLRALGKDGKWASKEAKVKIAAQPKVPNVKVDITKETTSIKKGMEWQAVEINNGVPTSKKEDWNSYFGKGLTLVEIKSGNAALKPDKDYAIFVRTTVSDKKIASKITMVTLNKPASALKMPSDNKFTGTAVGVNAGLVELNVPYDVTKGATFKNTGFKDLEWVLVDEGETKIKWNTLKASKDPENKPSKTVLKYSSSKKANTWGNNDKVKLFVRLAGIKQGKNGVATLSGISAGAVMAFKNTPQKLTLVDNNGTSGVTIQSATATTASIKVATGTATVFTFKDKIAPVFKSGSLKVNGMPKGITYKIEKITDISKGEFEVKINVDKKAFTTNDVKGEANFDVQYEGLKDSFKVKFEKN